MFKLDFTFTLICVECMCDTHQLCIIHRYYESSVLVHLVEQLFFYELTSKGYRFLNKSSVSLEHGFASLVEFGICRSTSERNNQDNDLA